MTEVDGEVALVVGTLLRAAAGTSLELEAVVATVPYADAVLGCINFLSAVKQGTLRFHFMSGRRFALMTEDGVAIKEMLVVAGVGTTLVALLSTSVGPVASPAVHLITEVSPDWNVFTVPDFNNQTVKDSAVEAFRFALNGGRMSPFHVRNLLPDGQKLVVHREGNLTDTVYVAAATSDWASFNNRHCDFLHRDMANSIQSKTQLREGGGMPHSENLWEFYDISVGDDVSGRFSPVIPLVAAAPNEGEADKRVKFCFDEGVVQLFKGEAGIGKTSLMLIGCSVYVDLVVYINLEDLVQRERKLVKDLYHAVETFGETSARYCDARDAIVTDMATSLVSVAVSAELQESLCKFEDRFRVRLVFDEAGSFPEFVCGLCGAGAKSIRDKLGCILTKVKRDHFCAPVCSNPRLAALTIVRCWNVTASILNNTLFHDLNSFDVRLFILIPVAQTFRSLGGLSRFDNVKDLRDTLVAALSLHPNFVDIRRNLDALHLVRKCGVLNDNSYYVARSRMTEEDTIMMNSDGTEILNPICDANRTEIACYPSSKGRFSISPAMVIVLLMLLVFNSKDIAKKEGDCFEVGLAQMLYVAVQVFEGRTIVELLEFLFAATVPAAVAAKLDGKIVAFGKIDLRYNQTPLQMTSVMSALQRASDNCAQRALKGPVQVQVFEDEERQERAEEDRALLLFGKLWRAEHDTAWVEVSPRDLSSADVVVHIPGVVTLPIRCEDIQKSFGPTLIERELDKMVKRPEGPATPGTRQSAKRVPAKRNRDGARAIAPPKPATTPQETAPVTAAQEPRYLRLAEKLASLSDGTVVVPVICLSRGGTLPTKRPSLTQHCIDGIILVDGYDVVPAVLTPRAGLKSRLSYERGVIRRSIFPFSLEDAIKASEPKVIDSSRSRTAE